MKRRGDQSSDARVSDGKPKRIRFAFAREDGSEAQSGRLIESHLLL